MHTIDTVIPAAARTGKRSTGPAAARGAAETVGGRAARLLSTWADRHLLGAPDAQQVPTTPRRELPPPWA